MPRPLCETLGCTTSQNVLFDSVHVHAEYACNVAMSIIVLLENPQYHGLFIYIHAHVHVHMSVCVQVNVLCLLTAYILILHCSVYTGVCVCARVYTCVHACVGL